jgi:hypothetical protein
METIRPNYDMYCAQRDKRIAELQDQLREAETALADCQEDGGHILRDAKTTARWRDRCMAEQDEMKAIIDRQETAMAAFRSFVRLVQKEGPYRCTYSHDWLDAFAAVEPFMGEEV